MSLVHSFFPLRETAALAFQLGQAGDNAPSYDFQHLMSECYTFGRAAAKGQFALRRLAAGKLTHRTTMGPEGTVRQGVLEFSDRKPVLDPVLPARAPIRPCHFPSERLLQPFLKVGCSENIPRKSQSVQDDRRLSFRWFLI